MRALDLAVDAARHPKPPEAAVASAYVRRTPLQRRAFSIDRSCRQPVNETADAVFAPLVQRSVLPAPSLRTMRLPSQAHQKVLSTCSVVE
jgi:hypothetical protein